MEPWSCVSEGKSLMFSDEIDLPIDVFGRDTNLLSRYDNQSTYNFENNGLLSGKVESMEFMELGLPEMMRKPIHVNSSIEILSRDVGNDSSKRVASPKCMITSNSSFGEDELGSKVSSYIMETDSHDSSLIALKLGRLADCKDAQCRELPEKQSILSSENPSLQAKKARTRGSYSQTPFCQVLGCNMDLSFSKDYHKRHKVCDVHSKTPTVIVNGIEQRFCQQCSRFHLLGEFDDGKRSCRRRLAGHNERRRKPQLDTLSGTTYMGTSLSKRTPFVFPEILPSGILYPEKYYQSGLYRHFKPKEESNYYPQLSTPINLHGSGEPHGSGITSLGSEDYTFSDMASIIQKLSGDSNSSSALSLLSAQLHDFNNLPVIPMANPLIIQNGHANDGVDQISGKPLRIRSTEKHGQNGFSSCGMNSMEVSTMGSSIDTDANPCIDFDVHTEGVYQDSGYLNARYCHSPERGATVDLLQLSSHLERVEQQRNSMQVKQKR